MFKVGDKVLLNEQGRNGMREANQSPHYNDKLGMIDYDYGEDLESRNIRFAVQFENNQRFMFGSSELTLSEPRVDTKLKDTNPKDSIGSDKIPLHLWPTTATVLGSMALLDGGLKYGRSNFRGVGVRASIYIDALQRHLFRWSSGEDKDPDSGLSHLAHILAGVAILVDAQAADKLNDDREFPGGLTKLIEELTPHVKRLKEQHKDKSPHHYTLADTPPVSK